jgi:integrase
MARKKLKGGFRKLPNGTIEYQVSLSPDIYGNRRRKAFYGKDENECISKHLEFIQNGNEEQTDKSKEHTLATWFDEWLPKYKQHKVEASTYADYVQLAAHVKKHAIGSMKLKQVKSLHITDYFNDKIDLSQSFRKRSKFLLNAAFEAALDNDFCDKNPVRRAEIASKAQPVKESYTESEMQIILDFAETDELFGIVVYIMLNTGVRAGEMRALQVSSIDFDKGFIAIDKAVKRTGKLGLPKNNKTRKIPLKEDVLEFLKPELQGKSGYIVGGDSYVTHSGFRGRYEWFFNRLNLFLESRGEKRIEMKSPHSTRHTFASVRQKNGMPIAILMELMGHKSREMTDHYTHVDDLETLTDAVRKYGVAN